ncbi:PREDICTED: probable disease resistance protein At5g63020 isoform X2 [Tarenaya hassleriana]|uniref:probable disease resistance protein At5g63020 isoform X2 n=1 Tax=Tarenaya hassleriana TaxID=28532 RepID=UPI00053C27CD|nr:PREDICTED: probable disease resistance protein At5g63020 isoform X2 [Tarenaya hassleriana]
MEFFFLFEMLWDLGSRLSKCLCGQESYISSLKENVEALQAAMLRLKDKRDDVKRRVSDEENKGLQRLAQVGGWLSRVEAAEIQVGTMLDASTTEIDRLCLCGYCSTKPLSSYDYGKEVAKKLKEIEGLESEERDFGAVAVRPPTSKVEKKDIQSTVVGLDSFMERAWERLMKEKVGIFGLYGMGGVGKTTLLKHIHNNFSHVENEFDVVIWAEVSRDSPIDSIQEQIRKRLGFRDDEWRGKTQEEKASDICNALSGKRFVLFMDDLWSEVDLSEIKVLHPTRENGCKVVFTTRSEEICIGMEADDNMEVKCLSWDDAWALFQSKVGEMALKCHPDIPKLARKIARKCGELPLALNIIGKAMASKKTVERWRHAIRVLNSSSHEFTGMRNEILPILRFSYDHLESEEVKMGFLYCALFPEDFEIHREQLIDYWICEGIIKTKCRGDRDEAVDEGHDIISTLVSACLLMDDESGERVKMHDVIREMALWIVPKRGQHEGCYIVKAGERLRQVPNIQNWEEVRRMSLMSNEIEEIDGDANCRKLTTLFLQKNNVKKISGEFFRGIKQLPAGLQDLRKLTHLNLEHNDLEGIGWRISSLRNLQVLRLWRSGVSCDLQLLEEIQQLEHLAYLTISVNGDDVGRFLRIRRLTSITRRFGIDQLSASVLVLDPTALGSLRVLGITDSDISEIKVDLASRTILPIDDSLSTPCFRNLSEVMILGCKRLKDLTWLLFAPNLVSLGVWYSSQVEEIINGESAEAIRNGQPPITPFEKLERLELLQLKKLKSICPGTLPFPNLKKISISKCPELRRLPLDSESARRGFQGIRAERRWAERVAWVDDAARERFLPLFVYQDRS